MKDIHATFFECAARLGVAIAPDQTGDMAIRTPITGQIIAKLPTSSPEQIDLAISRSVDAFTRWRSVPAPRRGELVRQFGDKLRHHKQDLGMLVSMESGKILQEGLGEVQEMIDICDFAVGLSRQLYGLTIASERANHKMVETWHPLGPVGVISAFNFPVAVWAWNTTLALVCGNTVIWKPSEKTPVTALACLALFESVAKDFEDAPRYLCQVITSDATGAEQIVLDARIPLVSATGSTRMGKAVAPKLAQRFARAILELGGNNAIIVAPSADLDLALPGIVFGGVGTAGQRCTSTRRLFVHEDIHDEMVARLKAAYDTITVGNPLESGTLVGPLIDHHAFESMQAALEDAKARGCRVHGGSRVAMGNGDACYVRPALVEASDALKNVETETFAPILYIFKYQSLADAIERNNAVPQGLSSSIFTNDLREAEQFTSSVGSDCGIANVNIGTSGAEIGGAFGGEKETGGGRESGSDAWKGYMRRMTTTINYGHELPLAQGITFEL